MNTSVKIKKKQSLIPGKPASLYLQIICKRTVRRISLDYKVREEEWDRCLESIRIPEYTPPERIDYLIKVNETLIKYKKQLVEISRTLLNKGELSASEIVLFFQQKNTEHFWLKYMDNLIREKESERSQATLRNYRSTFRLFQRFLEGKDVSFNAVNQPFFKRFEQYLLKRNLTPNTISFHCRILRMVWNRAVADGLIQPQPSPFHNICTQVLKTRKRAVDTHVISHLQTIKLDDAGMDFARDLFLFCYYARGMAFVDLAFLTHDNIQGNTLIYIRKKTGQSFRIELLPVMWKLLKKYAHSQRKYLFPILKSATPSFCEYDHALRLQNKRLQRISQKVGAHLSTYVARHTWASIAKKKGITDDIISEGMGHTSLRTTRIYIASLDYSRIDKANKIVLFGKEQRWKRAMGVP